jgi:hypothetical protein
MYYIYTWRRNMFMKKLIDTSPIYWPYIQGKVVYYYYSIMGLLCWCITNNCYKYIYAIYVHCPKVIYLYQLLKQIEKRIFVELSGLFRCEVYVFRKWTYIVFILLVEELPSPPNIFDVTSTVFQQFYSRVISDIIRLLVGFVLLHL